MHHVGPQLLYLFHLDGRFRFHRSVFRDHGVSSIIYGPACHYFFFHYMLLLFIFSRNKINILNFEGRQHKKKKINIASGYIGTKTNFKNADLLIFKKVFFMVQASPTVK